MPAEWVETIGTTEPTPAGGSVSATVVAAAAALVAKGARRLPEWAEASGIAAQALALRDRSLRLGDENDRRYRVALAELADRSEPTDARDARLGRALAASAETPLAIAAVAADVALLAVEVARHGDASVRGDVVAAAFLAAGAADALAQLVASNLTATPTDARVEAAQRHARRARDAAGRSVVE
jgi:formiminotetrahydrofolate cyclodeaminase